MTFTCVFALCLQLMSFLQRRKKTLYRNGNNRPRYLSVANCQKSLWWSKYILRMRLCRKTCDNNVNVWLMSTLGEDSQKVLDLLVLCIIINLCFECFHCHVIIDCWLTLLSCTFQPMVALINHLLTYLLTAKSALTAKRMHAPHRYSKVNNYFNTIG